MSTEMQSPEENEEIVVSKLSDEVESYVSFPRTAMVAQQEGWDSLLELEPWICSPGDFPPPSTPRLEMEKTPSSSGGTVSPQGTYGSGGNSGSRQGSDDGNKGEESSRQGSAALRRASEGSLQESNLSRTSKESLQVSSTSQESNGSHQDSTSTKENKGMQPKSTLSTASMNSRLSNATKERKIKVTVVSAGTTFQEEVVSPRDSLKMNLDNKVQRKSSIRDWVAQRKNRRAIPVSPHNVDSRVTRILAEGTVAPRIRKGSKILSEADRLYDLIEKAAEHHHRKKEKELESQATRTEAPKEPTKKGKIFTRTKKNRSFRKSKQGKKASGSQTTSSKTSSTKEESTVRSTVGSTDDTQHRTEDELQQIREIILSIRQARGDPDMPLSEIRKRLEEFPERDVRRLFHPSDSVSNGSSGKVESSSAVGNGQSESSESTLTGECVIEDDGEEELISIAYVMAAPSTAAGHFDSCMTLPGGSKCVRPCVCEPGKIERFGPLTPLERLGAIFFGGAEDADGDAESKFKRILSDITSYTYSASSSDRSDNSILQTEVKKNKSKDILDLLGGNPSGLLSTDVSNASSRSSTQEP